MMVRGRAPVRIDLAGGWTDVAPFRDRYEGHVVNAAINRFSYVTILPRQDDRITIQSSDSGDFAQAARIRELEYNGKLDLVKAALKVSSIDFGIDIWMRSDAPAGSGVGSSSSASVATVAALAKLLNQDMSPKDIAEKAFVLESGELKLAGGKQDQYASAMGGFNKLTFAGDKVEITRLQIPRQKMLELEEHLVLCYTGKSRLSGNVVSKVMNSFAKGEAAVTSALRSLQAIALEMSDALMSGSIAEVARLLSQNWRYQKMLDDAISTDEIERAFRIAESSGAQGGKVCGAGGGGCILFISGERAEGDLRRSLTAEGYQVLHFSFEDKGVEVWKP